VSGVFMSNDLKLMSPLIRVTGDGKADLNESEIDYTVNAKLIGSLDGQSGKGMNEDGLLLPVRIFGPFSAIETDVLLDNMLKQEVAKKLEESKQAIQEKKEKLKVENKTKLDAEKREQKAALTEKKKAAAEKLKNKLKGKLKGLF
jgi:AsmA protein